MKKIVAIMAVVLFVTNSAMAWGGFAHSAITEIAERNLTPQAREKIHYYLNHSLPFYAIWMDQYRYTDPYRTSGKWHSNWMDKSGAVDISRIVRSLAGDCHIVWMSLKVTCVSDAYELSFTKLLDVRSTAITHTCAETTYELVNHLIESTLVRNLSYDSLRNELLDVSLHILEVTVLRALLHSLERAHTTV